MIRSFLLHMKYLSKETVIINACNIFSTLSESQGNRFIFIAVCRRINPIVDRLSKNRYAIDIFFNVG